LPLKTELVTLSTPVPDKYGAASMPVTLREIVLSFSMLLPLSCLRPVVLLLSVELLSVTVPPFY